MSTSQDSHSALLSGCLLLAARVSDKPKQRVSVSSLVGNKLLPECTPDPAALRPSNLATPFMQGVEPAKGLEPITICLQNIGSTN